VLPILMVSAAWTGRTLARVASRATAGLVLRMCMVVSPVGRYLLFSSFASVRAAGSEEKIGCEYQPR
jgi:hypothetical protein